MTVNRIVLAVEALTAALVAVGLWLLLRQAADALADAGIPPLLAALPLFPIVGVASTIVERKHLASEARRWHGVIVSALELRVCELAGGDEDEGVAESEADLYDEGVQGGTE